jgi:hypothetical protein
LLVTSNVSRWNLLTWLVASTTAGDGAAAPAGADGAGQMDVAELTEGLCFICVAVAAAAARLWSNFALITAAATSATVPTEPRTRPGMVIQM